uniref:Uncharacterized protein n=1 Tax=Arundo donax TaxID=35708 RepID=A0A0A8ZK01_ARUDO
MLKRNFIQKSETSKLISRNSEEAKRFLSAKYAG